MDSTENDASNNSSIVASVFVAVGTWLRSRCLAEIGDTQYTQRIRLFDKHTFSNLKKKCLSLTSIFFVFYAVRVISK
jgi:hypothetical protein